METTLGFIHKFNSGSFDYVQMQKDFKKQKRSKKDKESILSWLGGKIQEIYSSGYNGVPLSANLLYRLLSNGYDGGVIL